MNSSPPAAADMAPGSPDTFSNTVDMPDVAQEGPSSALSPSSRQLSLETMPTSQLPSSSPPATAENVPMVDMPRTSPPSRQSTPPRPVSPEMTVSPLSASPSSPKTPTMIPEFLVDSPDDPPPPPSPRPRPRRFTNHFPGRPPLLHSTKASSQAIDSLEEGEHESLGLLTSALTVPSGVAQRRRKTNLHLRPPQRNDERLEGSSCHTPRPGPRNQAQETWSDTQPLRLSRGSSAWNPVNSSLPQKRKSLETLEVPSSSPPSSSLSSDLLMANTRNRPLTKPCTCDASQSSASDGKLMPTPPFTPGIPWPTSSQKPASNKISKADASHDVSSKRRTFSEDAHSSAPHTRTETCKGEQFQPADTPNTSPTEASLPPPPPIPETVRCYACTMNRAVQAEIEVRNRWAPKIRGLEYWIDGMKTNDRSSIAHLAMLRRYKIEDKMSYEDLRDHQIDEAWQEFNRWHGQEARRLAAAKAREQLLELCGYDDSGSDDSSSEADGGGYGDQDDAHSSEPKRGTKEGSSGGEAHEEDKSAGSGDMEIDELDDLRAEEIGDWDAEAERLAIARDQAWEDERRKQREENARLRAALEKSKADNHSLSMSIRHMQMILQAQEAKRKETVKSNPNWLKRLPEPNDLQPPNAKKARKDNKGSPAAAKNRASSSSSSSSKAGHLAKEKKDGTTKANAHEAKKRVNKNGIEEPLNWDPRNQCDAAALALKQYREELAMRENERCRRMATAATVPVVPMQGKWRKSFNAASE